MAVIRPGALIFGVWSRIFARSSMTGGGCFCVTWEARGKRLEALSPRDCGSPRRRRTESASTCSRGWPFWIASSRESSYLKRWWPQRDSNPCLSRDYVFVGVVARYDLLGRERVDAT